MTTGNLWRDVHERLLDAHERTEDEGRSGPGRLDLVAEELDRSRAASARLVRSLDHLRRREPRTARPDGPREDLWDLFALGVLTDHLLSWAVPGSGPDDDAGRPGADVELLELRSAFLEQIGLERMGARGAFSPAHHELVDVVADDTLDEVVVDDVLWPGFRMGELIVLRAGVAVRAPRDLLDAPTATRSRLYFTNWRSTRPTDDLSHGWGSNSRWRTDAIRCYEDDAGVHLNVDGRLDVGVPSPRPRPGEPADEEDPVAERREVLLHRCRVTGGPAAAEHEYWPYDDTLSMRVSRWPLRDEDLVPVEALGTGNVEGPPRRA